MARTRDRIIALTLAIVFFLTSVGVSGLIVWQAIKDDKETTVDANSKTALAGTQLADFTPLETVGELQVTDIQIGDGEEVKPGDTITADYTGADAATGEIFESSLDAGQPITQPLGGLIQGWQEGIPGMKVGGKRRLIIPAVKAYGDKGLVFDITLISIGAPGTE